MLSFKPGTANVAEGLARLSRLLWSDAGRKGHAQSVIQTGDLVVNLDTKTVEVSGTQVHLTGKDVGERGAFGRSYPHNLQPTTFSKTQVEVMK
jgi:hypothetical protein